MMLYVLGMILMLWRMLKMDNSVEGVESSKEATAYVVYALVMSALWPGIVMMNLVDRVTKWIKSRVSKKMEA